METTENEHRKFELNALRYRQPVQFHEQWQWRNYGRQWRQSPQGAPGKGAPRADSNVFFILFNYKILSRFVAANDTALNTLRPIRPCFTANNNQLGL